MKKGILAIDLFCGAGGLTRGLLDSGITVLKGYDINEKLKETYELNNRPAKFYAKNIHEVTSNEIIEGVDRKNNHLLLAGCAPCQPFSSINKNNATDDVRRSLLLQFGRLIKEIQPDFVLVENVPGLLKRGRSIFSEFEGCLQGYHYKYGVLDAKDYGVPQKRRRFILIASRHNDVALPAPTHGPNSLGKKEYVTVREAIQKYPPIEAGMKNDAIKNHESSNLSEINMLRLKHIKPDGGSRLDLPDELQLKCHTDHRGHTDVYSRMKWDDVAPTLTCKCTSISNGRFAHPSQIRGISVREAAALQSFRDDYVFYGTKTNTTRWVGNAVPVRFAKAFGDYFVKKYWVE